MYSLFFPLVYILTLDENNITALQNDFFFFFFFFFFLLRNYKFQLQAISHVDLPPMLPCLSNGWKISLHTGLYI